MVQVFNLPQKYDFGSELGSALGKGLQRGLTAGFQNQFEQQQASQQQAKEANTLQNVLRQSSGMDPQSQLQAILSAPISNETKRLAVSSITAQQNALQKAQPTAYQQQLLEQRKKHFDIQQSRLDQAREKGRKELPQMISNFTKGYYKDFDLGLDDKVELDKFVQEAYSKGADLNDALEQGLERVTQKKEILSSVKIPPKPFGASLRPEAKDDAMEKATSVLHELYQSGVTKPKDLRAVGVRGGWNKDEIDNMLEQVTNGKIKPRGKKESPEEQPIEKPKKVKQKTMFDSKNPEHVARAKQILSEVGGDKAKANSILAEEFTR